MLLPTIIRMLPECATGCRLLLANSMQPCMHTTVRSTWQPAHSFTSET
jgi:hypothetical protein